MGFFKWIKRELDAPGSCKRRQSEPPIVYSCLNSNSSRDESYIRAIFKFNEWRRCQRTQNLRYSDGKTNKRQTSRFYTKVEKQCVANNENISNPASFHTTQMNSNEIYEEVRLGIKNINTNSENIAGRSDNITKQKSKTRRCKHKRRTLIEHEIIEQAASPPTHFFRKNSNPFDEFPSPNKCSIHSSQHLVKKEAYSSKNNHCVGDCVQESAASSLQKDCNHNVQSPLPDVLSDHNEANNDGNQNTLAYQKIINIRGEEVEYALPYSEKNVVETQITNELNVEKDCSIYDNVPDEIRTNKKFSPERSILTHPLPDTFSDYRRSSQVIVTDLDFSNGATQSSKGDIFKELCSLEMWSKNIYLEGEDSKSVQDSVSDAMSKNSVIICRDMEVPEKNILIKPNEMMMSVFIRPGRFRKAIVTKYYVHHSEKCIVDKALQQNFLIMRKIRHPNICLLMATVFDGNQKFKSLILEPLSCSFNNLIYASEFELPIKDCLEYTIQVTKAIIYLHENGLVHSNISNDNIFMCQYNKQAKLSSFQLTTYYKTRVQNEISSLYGKESVPVLAELPTKHLPHFIEYRKIFSKHHYQAPELITSQNKFVFPSKLSDVYGIAICLWEMLHRTIPFALFSYSEMEKIFYLKQAQLPKFESKRCQNLDSLLEEGLRINPNKRIQTADKLCELLINIKSSFHSSDKTIKNFQTNVDKAVALPKMNGCTSTMKREKVLSSYPLMTSPAVEDIMNTNYNNFEEYKENTSDLKNVPKEYLFEIDQITLPETPIARQNKIRRTAWLTNKIVSPYDAPFIDSKDTNNTIDTPPSTKKYNINITIMHTDPTADVPVSPEENVNIQSQIQYWNSLTSPSELALNTQRSRSASIDKRNQDEFSKSTKVEPITPKNSNKNSLHSGMIPEKKKSPLRANYYPSIPEMLNESFSKRDKNTDDDFEKVFWKREKERCEKSNPSTPRRTSVKEAVHKFEQISSGANTTSPFPKIINLKNSDKQRCLLTQLPDEQQNIRRNLNSKKCDERESKNQVKHISTFEQNATSKTEDYKNKEKHYDQIHPSEQCSSRKTTFHSKKQKEKEIISKLDVILRSDFLNKSSRKSRSNPELNKLDTVDKRLKKNTRKLTRRASDVGCVAQRIIQTTREVTTTNDSVGGSELRKQITLFSSEINFNSPQLPTYHDLFMRNSQLYKEISCLDCGSHNVYLGDALRRYLQFQNSQIINASIDVGRVRNTISTVNESLEDLYIDDDLNYGPKLAPNMKLTKPEITLFNAFNIGALNYTTSSVSSSDLKLSDESLISNEDNGHT